MADLSLHYSSKAPLAGTLTAFNQIFATWRRRAKERRELSTLDARTLRDLGLSATLAGGRSSASLSTAGFFFAREYRPGAG